MESPKSGAVQGVSDGRSSNHRRWLVPKLVVPCWPTGPVPGLTNKLTGAVILSQMGILDTVQSEPLVGKAKIDASVVGSDLRFGNNRRCFPSKLGAKKP